MSAIKRLIMIVAIIIGGATAFAAVAPASTYAAAAKSCNTGFLTFPAWYDGLTKSDCSLKQPGGDPSAKDYISLSTYIWTIVLNAIDIALQLVGYITGFFILYGGFQYITSQGDAGGVSKAKTTLVNAIVGLVISIASVAIVNLVKGAIK